MADDEKVIRLIPGGKSDAAVDEVVSSIRDSAVGALEATLEMARAGKLRCLVIAVILDDGQIFVRHSVPLDLVRGMGACEVAKQVLLKHMWRE